MSGAVAGAIRLRPGLLLALIAGRGAFRATSQLAPLLLLAAWGTTRFGAYASAVGLCSWAMFVAASGEKAALKLIPRANRIGPDVRRIVLLIGATPLALALAGLITALVVHSGTMAQLILAAATYSAAIGMVQLVAGLHRLRGRPGFDAVAFASLAVLTVTVTGSALLLDWSPRSYLYAITVSAGAVALITAVRLPAGPRRPRRRVGGRVLRTAALLGLSELLGSLGVAACYLALNLTGQRTQSGLFYVAAVTSGFCSAAILYLLRLGQPATSLRQRGPAAATGRNRAMRVLAIAIAVAAGCTVSLVALTVAGITARLPAGPLVIALTVLEIPLFALVTYANYLLENTDGRAPVVTSLAATAGLLGVGAAAAYFVRPLGAAGAMAALIAGLGCTATALHVGVTRQHPRGRSERRFASVVRVSFATVPLYREHWALTGTPLTSNTAPIPAADIVERADDLVPLGSARDRKPRRADPADLVDPVLGRVAVRPLCGQWHVDTRRVHVRTAAGGVLAFTVLDRRTPRLVDIAPDPSWRLSTCPAHGSAVVVR